MFFKVWGIVEKLYAYLLAARKHKELSFSKELPAAGTKIDRIDAGLFAKKANVLFKPYCCYFVIAQK